MNVESWCQVEGSSNQKWTRSTRRHYEKALQSSVLQQEEPAKDEGRVDWSMAEKPQQEKLAKKKHFQQKRKLHNRQSTIFQTSQNFLFLH